MKLIMLGGFSGARIVTVTRVDGAVQQADNEWQTFVIEFSTTVPVVDGDSGAPLFYHDSEADTYQLVGIVFGKDDDGRKGLASRADLVASKLNLEFGKRPLLAVATSDVKRAQQGTTVTLDGRGSRDYEGDPLTYKWEKVSPTTLTIPITNARKERATFVAPNWRGVATFRLTVKNVANETASAEVSVAIGSAVVPKPSKPEAPPDTLPDVNQPDQARKSAWLITPRTRYEGSKRECRWIQLLALRLPPSDTPPGFARRGVHSLPESRPPVLSVPDLPTPR